MRLLAIGEKIKRLTVVPKNPRSTAPPSTTLPLLEKRSSDPTDQRGKPPYLEKKPYYEQYDANRLPDLLSKCLYETDKKPKIILLGASTGGPVALTRLLEKIPADFPIPMIIVQHMPENFTATFTERLDKKSHVNVKHAESGDKILLGRALLAPEGKQLLIEKSDIERVKVIRSNMDSHYKPSVDISLTSVSNAYGHYALAIILTGMG